ncbi:hypothetical protein H4K36_00165 [Streptomyces sp. DHE7-1]|nr:hypothetical protein [Streptomyces sp. DHE7-1]
MTRARSYVPCRCARTTRRRALRDGAPAGQAPTPLAQLEEWLAEEGGRVFGTGRLRREDDVLTLAASPDDIERFAERIRLRGIDITQDDIVSHSTVRRLAAFAARRRARS